MLFRFRTETIPIIEEKIIKSNYILLKHYTIEKRWNLSATELDLANILAIEKAVFLPG